MTVLLVHPGAHWSTADVEAGLRYGLVEAGVRVVEYHLDARLQHASEFLRSAYRRARRASVQLPPPTAVDCVYWANTFIIERALAFDVDAVIIVSGRLVQAQILPLLRRAGRRVFILFTESPYDMDHELGLARLVDGCWTNERSAVAAFQGVNPRAGYLPHGWHPLIHTATPQEHDDKVLAHDVVFVGTGWPERITWFDRMDWRGIDLGLYGSWTFLPARHRLRKFLRGPLITNRAAAALYRRAKVGINFHRRAQGFTADAPIEDRGDSLNPRAYELAACGLVHLSDPRAEVRELFGDAVPTFTSPHEAEAQIRALLALRSEERAAIGRRLTAAVERSSWVTRAACVVRDLEQRHRAA